MHFSLRNYNLHPSVSQSVSHMQRKAVALVLCLLPTICECNEVTTVAVLLLPDDFWVIIIICSLLSPSGTQTVSDCCTGKTFVEYVDVCHTHCENKHKLLLASSNPAPCSSLLGLCSPWSRWTRKRSLPVALLTCHKRDKRPFFYFLKCSPLALNILGFSELCS